MSRLFEQAGERLRADLPPIDDSARYPLLRRRLIDAATRPVARKRAVWVAGALAPLAVAGAVLLAVGAPEQPASLEFTVGVRDRPGTVGAYYTSSTGAQLPMRFSDGSQVRVASGGGLRVAELGDRATTLQLESGKARFRIQHDPGRAWHVLAGPYAVEVTGTSFTLLWDSPSRTLDLRMESGEVTVTGPGLESGRVVGGGEHFVTRVSIERGRATASSAARASAPPAASVSPEPEAPSRASPSSPRPRAPSTAAGAAARRQAPPGWASLAASGSYRRIVRAARQIGIERVLGTRSAAELRALSDAARFTENVELAERALLSVRARFAGSRAAADAAFVLGRAADDRGRFQDAIRWYDAHLREGGAFAPEALGRKMLVYHKLGDSQKARSAAARFLSRFPSGPYARQAKALAHR